jgi:hypothetical protein
MTAIGNIGNQSVLAASGMDLDAMGLEELIMYVQQKRAESNQNLLEGQVKAVQGRTNEINRLNGMMSKLNEASAAMAGKAADDLVSTEGGNPALIKISEASQMGPEGEMPGLSPEAKEKRMTALEAIFRKDYPGKEASWYTDQATTKVNGEDRGAKAAGATYTGATTDITVLQLGQGTKAKLDTAITNLKTQIDSLNNSQQTDMLRLQGLTTKYNESFDTMSNVMKKFDGTRSAIVGNLR